MLLFLKLCLLIGAAAGSGLLLALLCARLWWPGWRRRVLARLRACGRVEFTPAGVGWQEDFRRAPALPFPLFVLVPLLAGAAVTAGAVALGYPLLFPEFPVRTPAAVALIGGYGLLWAAGFFRLRRWREERERDLLSDGRWEWGRIGQSAAARWAELNALSGEIGRLGAGLELKLETDLIAAANGLFGELARRYPDRSDAALVGATLALCRQRLLRLRQEYAADTALTWEAVAALAEAEGAAARAGPAGGELLLRLGELQARLFAPALQRLLEQHPRYLVRDSVAAADYRQVVAAILREAEALAAEAGGGQRAGPPAPADPRGELSAAAAAALLGADPQAGRAELAALSAALLELWAGPEPAAVARRQELGAAAAVLRRQGKA